MPAGDVSCVPRMAIALSAWLLIESITALALAGNGPHHAENGSATLVLENDIFGRQSLDRDYTNGLELSWLRSPAREPGWSGPLVRLVTGSDDKVETRLHFAVGQQVYTPEDIVERDPVFGDRPYAGLLYASAGAIINANDERIDQVQLLLGVVGPASQADSLQVGYHRLIRARIPAGWSNQISNRPAGEVSWRRTHLIALAGKVGAPGFGVDFAPHYGARAGNLQSSISIGGAVRIGKNVPVEAGAARLKPSLPGAGYFKPSAYSGLYAYAGVEGRYVPRNLFLDEPGRNGVRVTRRDFDGDALIGIAIYRGPARLSYTHYFRTVQYNEQNRQGSEYGSLALTVNF